MTTGRGRLIALEGPDGCGKSTQARLLAERLGALLVREPGGTPLGELLREVLLSTDAPRVDERAEALLMLASRAQHVSEVIEPALGAGRWVITDRFSGSTLAYQGFGRGLDVDELRRSSIWASAGLEPDLTILLERDGCCHVTFPDRLEPDRLESEGKAFRSRVAAGFATLAAADPAGWVVVDRAGTIAEVSEAVWAAVSARFGDLLPERRGAGREGAVGR